LRELIKAELIQSWGYRYNDFGCAGLCDHYRGNKNKLKQHQQLQLRDYIDKAADDPHDGIRRRQDVRQWLNAQFDVCYIRKLCLTLMTAHGWFQL
jgi:hypothetical protein